MKTHSSTTTQQAAQRGFAATTITSGQCEPAFVERPPKPEQGAATSHVLMFASSEFADMHRSQLAIEIDRREQEQSAQRSALANMD